MAGDEVRRVVGRRWDIGFSDLNDEEIWAWRYREGGVRNMELYAHFDRPIGLLKKISRFQVDTSDGKREKGLASGYEGSIAPPPRSPSPTSRPGARIFPRYRTGVPARR